MRAVFEDARGTKKEIGTHYGVPTDMVHTARAVYCRLGDIRKGFVRPSKSDVSNNPSGKLKLCYSAKNKRSRAILFLYGNLLRPARSPRETTEQCFEPMRTGTVCVWVLMFKCVLSLIGC